MESDRIKAQEVLEQAAWARRVARAMVRDEHLAEDLAQDALEAGLRRKNSPPRGIRGWLVGTLRNLRRQAARKEEHLRDRELRAASTAPQAAPDELLEIIEAQRAVSDAVINLPEANRSALILRYYEQLPVREVARRLQISEKAAESRIQRSLQQLRDNLRSRHGSAWAAAVAPLLRASFIAGSETIIMTAKAKLFTAAACALLLLGAYIASDGFKSSEANKENELSAAGTAASIHQPDNGSLGLDAARLDGSSSAQDPARAPAQTNLTLRVVDPSGAPVPGARFAVFLADHAEALASGATDGSGTASIPASNEVLNVVLAASGHAPWCGALPAGLNPEIRLPPGKTVSGLVQVDGKPATRALPLELRSDLRLIPRGAVSESILALVGIDPQATGTFAGSCDAAGRFAFGGLPEQWEGSIRCTELLYMAPGQPSNSYFPHWTQIPSPHEDFILELRESPAARGRVVLNDERTPAFPGWVTIALHYPGKQRSLNFAELRRDGTFEVVMRPWHDPTEMPIRLEVTVTTITCPEKVWNFDTVPENLEVGTLILPPARSLSLEVRSQAGLPLIGARAGVTAWNLAVGPSGADGRLMLDVAADDGVVDITADGYLPERLTLPDGRDPIDIPVTLRPARDLKLLVRSPEGQLLTGAMLTISMNQDAREMPSWEQSPIAGISPGLPQWSTTEDGQVEFNVATESSGPLVVRYLLPGQLVRVRATPAGSAEMQEVTLGPMPEAGDLEHTFVMETGRRTFTGRITNPEGRGVRPMELKLVAEVGSETVHLATPTVDEEGVFSVDLLDEGAFFVVIEAAGFASVRREVVNFDEDAGPMIFRLGGGRSLEFRVLDEAGNHLEGVAMVNPEDRAYLSARLKDGACVIPDVPPEDLSVSVSVGGRAYRKLVSGSESRVEFILPIHGSIRLSLNQNLQAATAERSLRLILAPVDGGKQIVYWIMLPSLDFSLVPPGDYQAVLAATKFPVSFDLETLTDWKQIVVKPGEVTETEF